MRVNHSQGQLTYQIDVESSQRTGFAFDTDFLTTGKLGVLIPSQAMRVTYGDKVIDTPSAGVQLEPLAVAMMANMFMKQESYYTPYNCVWLNYDSWRSGGENLMFGDEFLAPAPNANMKQVFSVIPHIATLPLHFRVTDANVLYLVVSDFQAVLNQLKNTLLANSITWGVRDIYQVYVIDTLNEIINYVKDYDFTKQPGFIAGTTNTDLIPLFQEKWLTPSSSGDLSNNLRLPQGYELSGDWKELMNGIGNHLHRWQLNEAPTIYPNEFAVGLFNLFYKLIRPFAGVGSYLDNMGINRILPLDFYYDLCHSVFAYMHQCEVEGEYKEESVALNGAMYSEVPFNALNLRVLYLIWYNNYRDQLLEVSAPKPQTGDIVTDTELITLLIPRHRCWDKDTYTTALDNPATADAVVPLNSQQVQTKSQQVVGTGKNEVTRNDKDVYEIVFKDGEKFRLPTNFLTAYSPEQTTQSANKGYFSIAMLDACRRAQKFFRKAVYYGNRIQDFIYLNWQVKHLDARLRLPELLSVSQETVQMQTLVNNTTTAESVAGDRAGYAYGTDKGSKFDRFTEEDGVIISLFTLMPQATYGYGTDRQYACLDRYDMPLPDFATLGMDAVYDNEIMALPTKVWNEQRTSLSDMPNVFGYQGRYYSEKWRPSTEHGELLTTQDMYTFGRRFNPYNSSDRPMLNYEFVHCFPVTDMFILEDGREDVFRLSIYHDCMVDRTLPYHSIYF